MSHAQHDTRDDAIADLENRVAFLEAALRAIGAGRCVGHDHHPRGTPPCPNMTPASYARAVLGEPR